MIRLVVALGGLMGGGIWLLASGLRPAPPRLAAGLARLNRTDTSETTSGRPSPLALLIGRLAGPGGLTIPHRDLALLGVSGERFIGHKLALAAGGFLAPPTLTALAALVGAAPAWPAPAGAALVLAAAGFVAPDALVRSRAARRRADFRHALSAYLDLVRLAVDGGAGPSQALERAPRHSGGWAFAQIAGALQAARHARIPPWQGLAKLGEQIGVGELADLADMAELAGHQGAKIADSISAYTQQMRSRRLAELRTQAGARTTTMTAPIATLALGFIALLGFPQVYLLLQ